MYIYHTLLAIYPLQTWYSRGNMPDLERAGALSVGCVGVEMVTGLMEHRTHKELIT